MRSCTASTYGCAILKLWKNEDLYSLGKCLDAYISTKHFLMYFLFVQLPKLALKKKS